MENHQHEESKVSASSSVSPGASFVPPRHWIGPEELNASYWADSKIQEKRAQEFFEKPLEYLEKVDKMDTSGIIRRDFLTVMGASMAMASFACARRPVQKIIPYVVKPEEITPGVPNYYASTCKECASSCGVLVKTREGRPIKIEGNPEHPSNEGSLCARGQASVLGLYDLDRLKGPVLRNRSSGTSKEGTWNQADSEIQAKLNSAVKGGKQVRVLTGELVSDSTRRLVREFLGVFPANDFAHVEYEPMGMEDLSDSQRMSYGSALVPHYSFDRADYVLSLGADFLGTWLSPVEYSRQWIKKRKLSGQNPSQAKMSKLVCFESTMTLTGAGADVRHPVRPGDELAVALALVHLIISTESSSALAKDSGLRSLIQGYSPEKVAADLGLQGGVQALKQIASDLLANRGKSLVIAGGIHSKNRQSLALQIAVNVLNSVLGNEGSTVDGTAFYSAPEKGYSGMSRLIAEMNAGKVDVLVIHRVNPAYTLPKKAGFSEALKKVGTVVVISDRDDETAQLADYVLPDHHYLEAWGDATPSKGLYSLQQPTIAPIHNTRGFEDSLMVWVKGSGSAKAGLAKSAPDWHAYLKANWNETVFKESGSAGNFEQFWESVLREGMYESKWAKTAVSTSRSFKVESLKAVPAYSSQKPEVSLALYQKVSQSDGRHANNAWLQEMPDPVSSVTWDNYLNIGPALAKKLKLQTDDVVEVKTSDGSVELPIHIQPGMHPGVVSAAVGYGRKAAGKVGNDCGVDVFPLSTVDGDSQFFSGASVSLRKTGKFFKLASTQWHTASENRPIINDITLAEFKKNPGTSNHTDPHLRMETPSLWPVHEYKGYRWGMAIDLSTCTGCSACVIACQSENNIPVVGRNQVRVSRQMHWIHLDRYYSGNPENPEVIFQPMLCQHCENAPCETVCPVAATVHDDEGLNVQVYNRCVGTRYCQNNCPYKVRRFNFFDHWKSYSGTLNMAWNPDVTVRTRGIMEKCTFCTQRIREAKDKAKDGSEKVKDGDFKTACQQTCPTDAIVFGDINDPNSRVSKLRNSPQAFRVLESLNAKPAISYLTKVRNQEGVGGTHGH